MRAYRLWFIAGLVLVDLIAGFACILSVKYGSAPRNPWWVLGIVLIAFGATGAVVTVAMKAMRVETEEAHPSDDAASNSPAG